MVNIIVALPSVAGAVVSFARIQAYLNGSERVDKRTYTPNQSHVPEKSSASPTPNSIASEKQLNLADSLTANVSPGEAELEKDVVAAVEGKFYWPEATEPVINIECLTVRRAAFTLVLGPVGCGKSTLLKALLCELTTFEGTIRTSCSAIAYCEQSPWLPNATVKEVIVRHCIFDQAFYTKVLDVCAMEQDL